MAGPPGLVRERLLGAIEAPGVRLVLLCAAPGTGKSTLLAQHAARAAVAGRRTVWVRPDVRDRDEGGLVTSLDRALSAASGRPARPSPSSADVVQLMAELKQLTVLVDDAHVLTGSPAERTLAEVVEHAPDGTRFVVSGRHEPGPALVRLALAVDAVSLTGEDLRFRSWEVAELFDRLYGEPLPPEDTAALARHIEGWAAGLQMFHLATVDRPLAERRAAVAGLWGRGRLLRSYLAGTVLHGLDDDTRGFLVRTSALLLLDGPTCDALLSRTGGAALLDQLAERQLLTLRVDESTGLYRYHAALQVHLESLLVDELGADAAREWYRRAAALSESAGRPYEALRAYLRAGTWDEARRVLAQHGPHIAGLEVPEEAIVAGLADDDPWLALAAARSMLADGDLAGAVAAYRSATEVSGGQVVEEVCRHEGRCAEAWLPSGAEWPAGSSMLHANSPWPVALREALRSTPGRFLDDGGHTDPGLRLTSAVAALLAGMPEEAVRRARRVEGSPSGPVALVARLVAESVEAGLRPDRGATGLERLAAEAETLGQPWLARLSRALTAVPGGLGRAEAEAVRLRCLQEGDPWGGLLAGLAAGVGGLVDGEAPCDVLEDCVDRAHRLDAGTVEAWARGLHAVALARAGLPHVELEARRAETCARQVGVPAARHLAFSALAAVDGSYETLADVAAAEHRLPRPRTRPEQPAQQGSRVVTQPTRSPGNGPPSAPPPVSLRCLGGFSLSIAGVEVDWSLVRPRARTLLRMLAAHVGRPVNEEHLLEALWPRLPPSSARHNLHVAVSALRRALEPDAERGGSRLLVRDGPAYALTLPFGSEADVSAFRSAVQRWTTRRGAPPEVLRPLLHEVLALYTGDLLPVDGPAEWVVGERAALRSDAARAAVALAELELLAGKWSAAAEAGERAVQLDPFGDVSWRLLIAAYEAAGDAAARARTRRRYTAVLRELGVDGPPAT